MTLTEQKVEWLSLRRGAVSGYDRRGSAERGGLPAGGESGQAAADGRRVRAVHERLLLCADRLYQPGDPVHGSLEGIRRRQFLRRGLY